MGDLGGRLEPYVPRVASNWDLHADRSLWRAIEGTLVFVDISGFTNLSERLARRGRIGAEELTGVLNRVFGEMLDIVYARGGALLKFGGDALLLFFDVGDHVMQAAAATVEMRSALRKASQQKTSVGRIDLKMSSGIHTGVVDFFLVGHSHRELIVTGPTASITTEMEGTADASEIVVSEAVRQSLPSSFTGDRKGSGWLLRKRVINCEACGPVLRERDHDPDLSTFVPLQLREHLNSGLAEAEHRIASIGFVKFKGVDQMLKDADAEAVGKIVDELVVGVQQAADEEGVTFLGSDIDSDGGKIILAAGVPTSQHDDEGRLLRTARRILDSHHSLKVQIGVNRGHVFSGDVGTDFRRTYTVMGDTVNLAARLMATAPGGSLYASPGVLNLASTLFRTEPLEPFNVKGKEQPVHAFAVFEETGTRPPETDDELPFHGREAELEMLVGIVNTCSRMGRGGIMTISGDTGIGKTRLISEVLERCSGMDTLMIQAEPSGIDNPYWAFRDPLRRLLGIKRASQDEMAKALVGAIKEDAPDLEWAVPLLGDVLHIEVEDNETTGALDPQFRPERTADAIIDLLSFEQARPVAIVAEDGQWLDEASHNLLKRMGEAAVEHPWTVMVTARTEDSEFEPMGDVLVLHELEEESTRAIVIEATQATPLRPHELDIIVDRADGNPLFLGELIRVVSETGTIGELPDSLDAVVSREIDTLPPLPRRILLNSSVLGRRFRRTVLDEFLATDSVFIDDATRSDLSRFLEEDGEGRITYRHNVVHDIAYRSLSFSKRRELHARAGNVIEREAGEDPEAVAEYLANHYSQSGEYEKAWRYSLVAATKAQEAFANAEAVSQYRRALEAARALRIDDRDRAAIYESLGDCLDRLGEFEAARSAYQRAQSLIEDPERKANLMRVEAAMLKRSGKLSHALRTQTRGLKLAEEHGLTEIEVDLFSERAAIRFHQGNYSSAIELAQEAIRRSTNPTSAAVAMAEQLEDYARTLHEASTDHSGTRRALRIAEEIGDLHIQAAALNNLGMYAYFDGSWDEASDFYSKAMTTYRKTGDDIAAAYGEANTAEILSEQGHLEEAQLGFENALRVLRAAGDSFMSIFVLTQLGRVAVKRARLEEALRFFEQAEELALDMGAAAESVEITLRRAEALLVNGHLSETTPLIQKPEAQPTATPLQLRPLAHRVAGLFAMSNGARDAGLRSLQQALDIAREQNSAIEELHAIHALAAFGPVDSDLSDRAYELTAKLGIVSVPLLVRHLSMDQAAAI